MLRAERRWLLLIALFGAALSSSSARACDALAPWSRLPRTASQLGSPLPVSLTLGAFAAPAVFAPSGLDHDLRLVSQRNFGGNPNAEAVSVWTPFVLPVLLLGVDGAALLTGSCDVARPVSAMLQAAAISFGGVVALKWVTGRSWPNAGRDPRAPDRLDHPEFARRFYWFSYDRGSAWPSGHTAIMMAFASALQHASPEHPWLGALAYAATAGVAAGMWLGDHHWASDIVSGGLLGFAVGRSTGLAFRAVPGPAPTLSWTILPWSAPDARGVQALVSW